MVMYHPNAVTRLICFLGNPGGSYRSTRHNAGWLLIPYLSFAGDLVWQRRLKGEVAKTAVAGQNRYLLKPLTFMNRSGESVAAVAGFYKATTEECLVVHDDVELDFGDMAVRVGGGLAGHNGLRSIAQHLGSREFRRLRFGVGRPHRGDVSSHVLGKFTTSEEAELPDLLSRAATLLEAALS